MGTTVIMTTLVVATLLLLVSTQSTLGLQDCTDQRNELLHRLAMLTVENNNLKTAAGLDLPDLPRSTEECDWDTGLACAGDIGQAVLDCAAIAANPLEGISCVEDIVGAGLAFAGSLSGCWGMGTVIVCNYTNNYQNYNNC